MDFCWLKQRREQDETVVFCSGIREENKIKLRLLVQKIEDVTRSTACSKTETAALEHTQENRRKMVWFEQEIYVGGICMDESKGLGSDKEYVHVDASIEVEKLSKDLFKNRCITPTE
jgi:hypothetical protein